MLPVPPTPTPEPSPAQVTPGAQPTAAPSSSDVSVDSDDSETEPDPCFRELQPKADKVKANSIRLKWKKVSGAAKYIVYGNKNSSKAEYKELRTTAKLSANIKKINNRKLSKGTCYRFKVVALDDQDKVISVSTDLYVVTNGGKYGNPKSLKVNIKKNKLSVKKNKNFKVKASITAAPKKAYKSYVGKGTIRYESSDVSVAKVSGKGVIKGVNIGKCNIYIYTQNGLCKVIKVNVK